MDKLLSVIIPVYNVEAYIDNCVSSIVNQTYRNLEILLVDDGSTDSSGMICDAWKQRDARVRVIHKENGGVSSARNVALEAVSGDFVTFVDADDWLDETAYEKIMKAMDINHADAAFFGYTRVYLDQTSVVYTPQGKSVCIDSAMALEKCLRNEKHGGGYNTGVCNKVFRVSLIRRKEGILRFDEAYTVSEDELWLYHIFEKSFQVYCDPAVYYFYRERIDSAMDRRDVGEVNKYSLDNLRARRKIYKLTRQKLYPHNIRALADARIFYYSYQFYLSVYGKVDKPIKEVIRRNFRWSFLKYVKSDNYSFLGKMRVITVLLMIECHFPKRAIDWVVRL